MRIVKAGLEGLRIPDLVGKSEHVEEQMTGNVNFATPTPSLAAVTAARVALVAAIKDAQNHSRPAIATKNEAAKTLHTLLVQLARYVNSVAGGDIDKAVSSGFDLAKVPDPIDKLVAPSKFEAVRGSLTGEIDLHWKGVRGGRLYQVYSCDGDPNSVDAKWTIVGMTTKARYTVKGLIKNKGYSFRVTALGVVGEGPASEISSAEAA